MDKEDYIILFLLLIVIIQLNANKDGKSGNKIKYRM
jgi:hypothetical protein